MRQKNKIALFKKNKKINKAPINFRALKSLLVFKKKIIFFCEFLKPSQMFLALVMYQDPTANNKFFKIRQDLEIFIALT